ncbi:RHS repeat-associated core domain-containing protein [Kitasatospora aburaviensis]
MYDADGQRLVRRDSAGTTLYLPGGNELKLAGGTVTGTRYYTHGGKTAAVRSAGKLTFVLADNHGTATVHVDAATQAVTRRKTTLFGAERGTAPGSGWVGDHGFVGGVEDGDSGLTHLGAREYDPGIGRFISVDPKLDSTSSQELNAYGYANNNPLSTADPSGEALPECWSGQYTCTNGDQAHRVRQQLPQHHPRRGRRAGARVLRHARLLPAAAAQQRLREAEQGRAQVAGRLAARGGEEAAHPVGAPDEKKRKELDRSFNFTFNSAEAYECVQDLNECAVYVTESVWAMEQTLEYTGETKGEKANAYRHVLWQGTLTARLGKEKADKWAAAHEAFYPADEESDHTIDLLNNEYGQALGERAAREANGNKAVTNLLIKRGARSTSPRTPTAARRTSSSDRIPVLVTPVPAGTASADPAGTAAPPTWRMDR